MKRFTSLLLGIAIMACSAFASATNDRQSTGPSVQVASDQFAGFGTFAQGPADVSVARAALHMETSPPSDAPASAIQVSVPAHVGPTSSTSSFQLLAADKAKVKKAKASEKKAMLERAPGDAIFRTQHRT